MTPLRIALGLIGLLVALAPRPSGAHALNPALLEIVESAPGHYVVTWKGPRLATSDTVLDPSRLGLQPVLPAECVSTAPLRSLPGRGGIRRLELRCDPPGLAGRSVSVSGPAVSIAEVVVRWVPLDGPEVHAVLRGASEAFEVPASRARSFARTLWSYLGLGLAHIAGGIDHLLFLTCLLLLNQGGRALVAAVTAFTLAHSLTLALATTGLVRLAPAPVEVLIAFSVALLAAQVVRSALGDAPEGGGRPWQMAFAFGLLHGFGFAGALVEVGLSPDRMAASLLGFNLGVEAGQLVYVLLAWLPLVAARRVSSRMPLWVRCTPAYAIGCVAAVWTVERAWQVL